MSLRFSKDFVNDIKRAEPKVGDIMSASPFDPTLDLGGHLEEDGFFENMYVSTSMATAVETKILDTLYHPLCDPLIIFLHGHSGTGKTTLLRHFFRSHSESTANKSVSKQKQLVEYQYVDLQCARPPAPTYGGLPADLGSHTEKLIQELLDTHDGPFSRRIQALKLARQLTGRVPLLHHVLSQYLSASKRYKGALCDLITVLRANRDSASQYFSSNLLDVLALIENVNEIGNSVRDILSIAEMSDVFQLYVMVALICRDHADRPFVLCFDNLDRVEINWLAPQFVSIIPHCIVNLVLLCRDKRFIKIPVNFVRTVRLVLCMREATFSAMTPHDIQDMERFTEKIDLRHDGDMVLSGKVLESRLQLCRRVFGRGAKKSIRNSLQNLDSVLRTVIPHAHEGGTSDSLLTRSEEQFYFSNVISPFFNCDLKKLIGFLVAESEGSGLSGFYEMAAIAQSDHDDERKDTKRLWRYGFGGDWVFRSTRYLMKDEFASGLFARVGQPEPKEGHCLVLRMMLSVLLNHCDWSYSRMDPRSECSLDTVITSLIAMYPLDALLKCVAESFLTYSRSWVNLITVENRRVTSVTAFEDIYKSSTAQALTNSQPQLATSKWLDGDRSIREKCEYIKLRLNRSGFVFQKYVFIHFEFYGAMVKNKKSLFACGTTPIKDRQKRETRSEKAARRRHVDFPLEFLFEDNIWEVFERISVHCSNMQAFYENKINTGLGIGPLEYKKSDYAFKYLGKVHDPKREEGHFHITRIVNSMIGYIDNFRQFLLQASPHEQHSAIEDIPNRETKTEKEETLEALLRPLSREERIDINRKLVKWLNAFAQLHKLSADPISQRFLRKYNEIAVKLNKSGYTDFETRYEIPDRLDDDSTGEAPSKET